MWHYKNLALNWFECLPSRSGWMLPPLELGLWVSLHNRTLRRRDAGLVSAPSRKALAALSTAPPHTGGNPGEEPTCRGSVAAPTCPPCEGANLGTAGAGPTQTTGEHSSHPGRGAGVRANQMSAAVLSLSFGTPAVDNQSTYPLQQEHRTVIFKTRAITAGCPKPREFLGLLPFLLKSVSMVPRWNLEPLNWSWTHSPQVYILSKYVNAHACIQELRKFQNKITMWPFLLQK